MMVLRKLRNAVQHTREAESIDSPPHQWMLGCLLFSSRGDENKWANAVAHSFAGAQRDLDFVRDGSEERPCRCDQVVRGCRARRQTAEGWRLLAYEIGGRNPAAEANVGDRFRAVQAGDSRETPRPMDQLSGDEDADAR